MISYPQTFVLTLHFPLSVVSWGFNCLIIVGLILSFTGEQRMNSLCELHDCQLQRTAHTDHLDLTVVSTDFQCNTSVYKYSQTHTG